MSSGVAVNAALLALVSTCALAEEIGRPGLFPWAAISMAGSAGSRLARQARVLSWIPSALKFPTWIWSGSTRPYLLRAWICSCRTDRVPWLARSVSPASRSLHGSLTACRTATWSLFISASGPRIRTRRIFYNPRRSRTFSFSTTGSPVVGGDLVASVASEQSRGTRGCDDGRAAASFLGRDRADFASAARQSCARSGTRSAPSR